jgi:hypothetical protein
MGLFDANELWSSIGFTAIITGREDDFVEQLSQAERLVCYWRREALDLVEAEKVLHRILSRCQETANVCQEALVFLSLGPSRCSAHADIQVSADVRNTDRFQELQLP